LSTRTYPTLPYEFAPVGGVEGIGFVRANALYRALEMLNLRWVDFGPFVFSEDIKAILMEVFSERYTSAERIRREAERTYELIRGKRYLWDENLVRILSFAVMGRDALSYLKTPVEELIPLLRERF